MRCSRNIVIELFYFLYLLSNKPELPLSLFFLVATLTTLVQDVRIAPPVAVLWIRFSVKWVSGSVQRKLTSVMDK